MGDLLGASAIASAILDRLPRHSHVLNIRGESYRLREKRQVGLFSCRSEQLKRAATTTPTGGIAEEYLGRSTPSRR